MAFRFPFTNYHELNLDWILKKLEELFNASAQNVETIESYEGRLTTVEGDIVTIRGNANQALQIATGAQSLAETAQQTGQQALAYAQTAQSTAAGAINASGTAMREAQTARQEAQQAIYIAQNTAGQLNGQIEALQAESERQQQAIENKGQEILDSLPEDYTELAGEVEELNKTVYGEYLTLPDPLMGFYTGTNTTQPLGSLIKYTANTNSRSYYIDMSAYVGETVTVKFDTENASGHRVIAMCDASDIIRQVYKEPQMTPDGVKLNVTDTEYKLYFSYNINTSSNPLVYVSDGIAPNMAAVSNALKTVYVSTSGSDNNTGASGSPLLTINKALSLGASNIVLMGGVYQQQIDLSLLKHAELSISKYDLRDTVIFKDPAALIASSAVKTDGYNNVYQCEIASWNSNITMIFQEAVADAATTIPLNERLPLQRGKITRCEDTLIIPATASSLNDALTELDNDAAYKYFVDGTTLYFTCPQTVSELHPISTGKGNTLFLNNKRCSVNMTGVDVMYYNVNLNNTENSSLTDCSVRNALGEGGFTWDQGINVKFIRCEAYHTFNNTHGDGFNASTSGSTFPLSKQCSATLIDCWGHDNNDDGYSVHQHCEDTLVGGLFEYNKKSGVAPSYGSHVDCYNVICRHNYNGFYVLGANAETEGGVNCQLLAVNCIAFQNMGLPTAHGDGFRCGGNNQMTLINCKAIENKYALRSSDTSLITCIDLGEYGSTTRPVHADSGTIVYKNTTIMR